MTVKKPRTPARKPSKARPKIPSKAPKLDAAKLLGMDPIPYQESVFRRSLLLHEEANAQNSHVAARAYYRDAQEAYRELDKLKKQAAPPAPPEVEGTLEDAIAAELAAMPDLARLRLVGE